MDRMNFGRIASPLVEPDGSVWASSRFGAVFLRNNKWQILSDKNGLPCNRIYTLIKDFHGSLWLYAECGLIEVKKTELENGRQDLTFEWRFRRSTRSMALNPLLPRLVPLQRERQMGVCGSATTLSSR
jgi:ligand-binding sensor domain-containing protein